MNPNFKEMFFVDIEKNIGIDVNPIETNAKSAEKKDGEGDAVINTQVSKEDLKKINSMNRNGPLRKLTAEDIQTRSMIIMGEEPTSKMSIHPNGPLNGKNVNTLAKLAKLLPGSPMMIGHRMDKSPWGRTFGADVITGLAGYTGAVVKENYWFVNDEEGQGYSRKIDCGIWSEGSISYWFKEAKCSICHKTMASWWGSKEPQCEHKIGVKDEATGQICFWYPYNIQKVAETSIVFAGAYGKTRSMLSAANNDLVAYGYDDIEIEAGIALEKQFKDNYGFEFINSENFNDEGEYDESGNNGSGIPPEIGNGKNSNNDGECESHSNESGENNGKGKSDTEKIGNETDLLGEQSNEKTPQQESSLNDNPESGNPENDGERNSSKEIGNTCAGENSGEGLNEQKETENSENGQETGKDVQEITKNGDNSSEGSENLPIDDGLNSSKTENSENAEKKDGDASEVGNDGTPHNCEGSKNSEKKENGETRSQFIDGAEKQDGVVEEPNGYEAGCGENTENIINISKQTKDPLAEKNLQTVKTRHSEIIDVYNDIEISNDEKETFIKEIFAEEGMHIENEQIHAYCEKIINYKPFEIVLAGNPLNGCKTYFQIEKFRDLPKGNYHVLPKYDGVYFELHKNDEEIKLLNENGEDYSEKFPQIIIEAKVCSENNYSLAGQIVKYNGRKRGTQTDVAKWMGSEQEKYDDKNFKFKTMRMLFDENKSIVGMPLSESNTTLKEKIKFGEKIQSISYKTVEHLPGSGEIELLIENRKTREGAIIIDSTATYLKKDVEKYYEWKSNYCINVIVKEKEEVEQGQYKYLCELGTDKNTQWCGEVYRTEFDASIGDVLCVELSNAHKDEESGKYSWILPQIKEKRYDLTKPDEFSTFLEILPKTEENQEAKVIEKPAEENSVEKPKTSTFVFQKHGWGKGEHYDLRFEELGKDSLEGWTCLNDLPQKPGITKIRCQEKNTHETKWKETDSKYIAPGKEGNPTKDKWAWMVKLDDGECEVIRKTSSFIEVELKGAVYNGRYIWRKIDIEKSQATKNQHRILGDETGVKNEDLWIITKPRNQELKSPVKKLEYKTIGNCTSYWDSEEDIED